jgi:hypothetical protein
VGRASVSSVALGDHHALFLDDGGSVWACGENKEVGVGEWGRYIRRGGTGGGWAPVWVALMMVKRIHRENTRAGLWE